jgi:hypothetical protein
MPAGSGTLTLAAGVYYLLDTSSDASDEQFTAAKRLDENAFDDMPGIEGDWVGTGTISPGYQQVLTYHVPPRALRDGVLLARLGDGHAARVHGHARDRLHRLTPPSAPIPPSAAAPPSRRS